mmetsp:Transcript_43858/g.72843  ORF Transcript_43858/g.72843 Transcript_43858/m.72843 type:complete len:137 (-) Transcript_43858:1902-2312(-)
MVAIIEMVILFLFLLPVSSSPFLLKQDVAQSPTDDDTRCGMAMQSIKLVTIGDSLTQGVASGGAGHRSIFHVYPNAKNLMCMIAYIVLTSARYETCYPTLLADALRIDGYKRPKDPLFPLPFNVEDLLREVERKVL